VTPDASPRAASSADKDLVSIAEPTKAFDDHFFSDFEMLRDGGNRQSDKALTHDELVFAQGMKGIFSRVEYQRLKR
jgi:hypothetical protein